MFGTPKFSGPLIFAYVHRGISYTVKRRDDGQLLGFLKNGKKHTFSLYLEDPDGNSARLSENIAGFLNQPSSLENMPKFGIFFRVLSFILARKILNATVIYDAQELSKNHILYRANNHSKCYLCDVAGWKQPSVMFLYVHRFTATNNLPAGGGTDKITFKHFFFPKNELENLQTALAKLNI